MTTRHILQNYTPVNGCFIWNGAKNGGKYGGYGVVRHKGKLHRVTRLVYRWFKGSIKPGNVIRHECDTPACINPKHLKQGTQARNVMDAIKKGRR